MVALERQLRDNTITDEQGAQVWVAGWVAGAGHVRPGILETVVDGLRTALAIMSSAPDRYAPITRLELREAIDYLTRVDWTDPAVCAATF